MNKEGIRAFWIRSDKKFGNYLQFSCGKFSENCSRSPCGERGLKYPDHFDYKDNFWSLPMRGARIEMI